MLADAGGLTGASALEEPVPHPAATKRLETKNRAPAKRNINTLPFVSIRCEI